MPFHRSVYKVPSVLSHPRAPPLFHAGRLFMHTAPPRGVLGAVDLCGAKPLRPPRAARSGRASESLRPASEPLLNPRERARGSQRESERFGESHKNSPRVDLPDGSHTKEVSMAPCRPRSWLSLL